MRRRCQGVGTVDSGACDDDPHANDTGMDETLTFCYVIQKSSDS